MARSELHDVPATGAQVCLHPPVFRDNSLTIAVNVNESTDVNQ